MEKGARKGFMSFSFGALNFDLVVKTLRKANFLVNQPQACLFPQIDGKGRIAPQLPNRNLKNLLRHGSHPDPPPALTTLGNLILDFIIASHFVDSQLVSISSFCLRDSL